MYPTEDGDKVKRCLESIIINPEIKEQDSYLIVRCSEMHSLSPIREKLKQQRIRDSARKILLGNLIMNSLRFYLNKQAAFVGRIHFVTNLGQEDYLGPITMIVEAEENDLKKLINWLTSVDFEVD